MRELMSEISNTIRIKRELVFKDVIKESTMSCVGGEKHEQ